MIERLPYLKDLGVTALWLNPWYDNVNHPNERETYDGQAITDYHGYGAVDFYAVEERLGDLATLRELVDAAHALGIKVIQDQVANHTGPYHPWVDGLADAHLVLRDAGEAPREHLADVDARRTPTPRPRCRRRRSRAGSSTSCPTSNQDDPEVRPLHHPEHPLVGGGDRPRRDPPGHAALRATAASGGTGWRPSRRSTRTCGWWGSCSTATPRSSPSTRAGVARFDGIDSGVDTLFDFPLFYEIRDAFAKGESLREVAKMLARDHLYRDPSLARDASSASTTCRGS